MDLWVDELEGLSLLSLLEKTEGFLNAVTLHDYQSIPEQKWQFQADGSGQMGS